MKNDSWYIIDIDQKTIKKERQKARELRKSNWWQQIVQKGECYYCGEKIKAGQNLTMDHVVPIARGGKSTKGNIVPSCQKCNQSKKLATPVEQLLEDIASERSNTN